MKIYPAIDLRKGHCVRLRQGRAEDETIYSHDPVAMALDWQARGAEFLHIVDLDGAFEGKPVHTEVFRMISAAMTIPFEVGGGLRTDDDVRKVLDSGARRIILGSRALHDPDAVERLISQFGAERIVVGIDARDGFVQVAGWTETSSVTALSLAQQLVSRGVQTIIYTDTATDGMMQGPNLKQIAELAKAVPSMQIVASGGVSKPSDIAALAALGLPNLDGAIVGKALYEKPDALSEFLQVARS